MRKPEFCEECAKTARCTRQFDEEQHRRCPILNGVNEPLSYRNSEGYSDPTAFFALRNALKKPKHEREKPRCPRTQVVHYD